MTQCESDAGQEVGAIADPRLLDDDLSRNCPRLYWQALRNDPIRSGATSCPRSGLPRHLSCDFHNRHSAHWCSALAGNSLQRLQNLPNGQWRDARRASLTGPSPTALHRRPQLRQSVGPVYSHLHKASALIALPHQIRPQSKAGHTASPAQSERQAPAGRMSAPHRPLSASQTANHKVFAPPADWPRAKGQPRPQSSRCLH